MAKNTIVMLCIIFLSGCATLPEKNYKEETNQVSCDSYSQLGRDYYKSVSPKLVANMDLTLPDTNGALTKFKFVDEKFAGSEFKKGVVLTNTEYGPSLAKGPYPGEYAALLIPPKLASQYFDQRDRAGHPIPLFLAIPKSAFLKGRCFIHQQPFVISSILQETDPGIAQLVLPQAELKRLVSHLFLDKNLVLSDAKFPNEFGVLEQSVVNAMLEDIGEKAVNLDTWGGWINISVDKRSRNTWDWLTSSNFGRTGTTIDGILYHESTYSAPSVQPLIDEYQSMRGQWDKVLANHGAELNRLYSLVIKAKSVLDSPVEFVKAYENAEIGIRKMDDYIQQQQPELLSQRSYFITDAEVEFYNRKLRRYYDLAVNSFNSISSAYADSLRVTRGEIPVKKIMSPPSTIISKPVIWDGLRYPFNGIGSIAYGKGSVYMIKTGNKNIIELNVLLNLNQTINSMKGIIESEINRQSSCETLVQGIEQHGPTIDGNTIFLDYSSPVLLRICGWTKYPCFKGLKIYSCKLSFTTTVATVVVRVKSFASIFNALPTEHGQSYADLGLDYGYEATAGGFPISSMRERTDGLLSVMKRSKKFDELFRLKPSINKSELGKGDDGNQYIWISIRSAELDDTMAKLTLSKLKESIGDLATKN